jgi:hypothetical protein
MMPPHSQLLRRISMSRKATLVLIVVGVLVLGAAASGGGKWLAHKVRVMHGGH